MDTSLFGANVTGAVDYVLNGSKTATFNILQISILSNWQALSLVLLNSQIICLVPAGVS